jgi:DnaJ-class molecular chaperone
VKKGGYKCPDCGGSGKHPSFPGLACESCHGQQFVTAGEVFEKDNARRDVDTALNDKNLIK